MCHSLTVVVMPVTSGRAKSDDKVGGRRNEASRRNGFSYGFEILWGVQPWTCVARAASTLVSRFRYTPLLLTNHQHASPKGAGRAATAVSGDYDETSHELFL